MILLYRETALTYSSPALGFADLVLDVTVGGALELVVVVGANLELCGS